MNETPLPSSVIPNAGIAAQYRKRLNRLVADMQRSILYWLSSTYKQALPKMAQDDLPSDMLQETMERLATQWTNNFDKGAEKLGEWFAKKTKNYADGSLQRILKEAGYTIDFTVTEGMRDAYQSVIHQQVGLIKSIASQHLQEVQGLVMRSAEKGRDLDTLSKALAKRYGITKKRAALIARDQNNKATSTLSRKRQQDLGIKKGIWKHSHGGRHPRPSHVAADGKEYDLDKGMYIDGEWIFPGEEINCGCTCRPIIPGLTKTN